MINEWTSEIGTTSEQRTKDLLPKRPFFGGSTVLYSIETKLFVNALCSSGFDYVLSVQSEQAIIKAIIIIIMHMVEKFN